MTPRLAFIAVYLALSLGLSHPCQAQFYLPDTECHDLAQRRFVVEFYRVLAWQQNQGATGPKVAEVSFIVDADVEHKTMWHLRWLDADGKSLREDTVSYPEAALASGPAWYRDVARQLSQDRHGAAQSLTGRSVEESYWQGAESAQPSRMDSLRQAFALDPVKDSARLAGLLAQAALPSMGYRVSLDGALLARSAAWLCLSEASVKEPAPKLDALWAPILFLTGREFMAADLWKKSPPSVNAPVVKWWGFLLSRPTSGQVFAALGQPQNLGRALPTLVQESLLLNLGELLAPVLRRLFADEKTLAPWHDYAPLLELNTSVGGGRLLEGQWPLLSRLALVRCLRQCKPEATDFHDYVDALSKITGPSSSPVDENADPSLTGWQAMAPLINLGYSEGVGKLTPVAVVTTRDLLNFAWESNGLQMGARWKFLAYYLGVPEEADAVAKAVLGSVDGSEPFFVQYPYNFANEKKPSPAWKFITRPRLNDYARLQEIGGADGAWVVPRKAFDKDKGKNALLWIRRCWLLPDQLLDQSRELYFSHRWDNIAPTLHQLVHGGGLRIDSAALDFYAYGLTTVGVKQVAGSEQLRLELLQAQRETSSAALLVMQRFDPLSPFGSAQRLEKVFWQRPGSDLPYDDIFSDYLRDHAYKAAKRFYTQAKPFLTERVGFSNSIGPRRFTLAMLEGDRAAMQEALAASASGSNSDMVMEMMYALSNEDYQTLGRMADELHDRYGAEDSKDDMGLKLKGFLPLVPALKNPADPDHAKALDYFGNYRQWPTLQWEFIQKAKLSTEDAVRFLGGKDTDPERRLLVAYVLKDKELFTKTYTDLENSFRMDIHGVKQWSNMAFVVVHWLRNDLFVTPVPAEQPDLKPSGAKSLLEAFMGQGL